MLDTCRIYHHTPPERYMEKGQYLTLELASAGRDKSFVGVFRLEHAEEPVYHLVPRGLSVSGEYEIYFDNSGDRIRLSGYRLMNGGLDIRLPGKLTSEVVVIKRCSE